MALPSITKHLLADDWNATKIFPLSFFFFLIGNNSPSATSTPGRDLFCLSPALMTLPWLTPCSFLLPPLVVLHRREKACFVRTQRSNLGLQQALPSFSRSASSSSLHILHLYPFAVSLCGKPRRPPRLFLRLISLRDRDATQ